MVNKSKKLVPIRIGNKLVGEGRRCYIIAEIGSNFDGNISKAKKLIKLAKECGADAAKFQSFRASEFISKRGFENSAFEKKFKKSAFELYHELELPRTWNNILNDYCKKIGIHFFTSPWDYDAVDDLVKLNSPAIKIGSGDITNIELLKYIGSTQKPVLLATGISTLKEVDSAVKAIKSTGNNRIILLHCVVTYPSPIEEANLKALHTLKEKFGFNVGYSDHSSGSLIPVTSVAMGGCILEKHFTVNTKDEGPDHAVSMDPISFKRMVEQVRLVEKALGNGIKKPYPSEMGNRIWYRRGIWTVSKIKKGEKFSPKNIKPLRPAKELPASIYSKIIGKKAKKNFDVYESLTKKDI